MFIFILGALVEADDGSRLARTLCGNAPSKAPRNAPNPNKLLEQV
jgi:hypothetical protein